MLLRVLEGDVKVGVCGCEVAGSARQENERRTTLAKKCAHTALHIRAGGRRGHSTKIFPKKGRELQKEESKAGTLGARDGV